MHPLLKRIAKIRWEDFAEDAGRRQKEIVFLEDGVGPTLIVGLIHQIITE
jgi:hypothetical protein